MQFHTKKLDCCKAGARALAMGLREPFPSFCAIGLPTTPPPIRLERPTAVLADADARSRVGTVALLGRALHPERRTGFEIVLAAGHVARDVGARRHHNPLLALGILDQQNGIAAVGSYRTNN